ncbi:MAG TPA: nucleoside 2-deoxyribosyltransferase [Isosphaeraceae bacterium]|nr:nucleoside 2-deoxyribosyltransferase [Isosphaeraceae bacterium]
MHVPEFSADQVRLLSVVYSGFRVDGTWPTTAYVDSILAHDHGLDIDAILAGMPPGVVRASGGYGTNSTIEITIAGLRGVAIASQDLQSYVAIIRHAAKLEREIRPGPREDGQFDITSEMMTAILGQPTGVEDARRLLEIMRLDNLNSGSGGPDPDGKWMIHFDRRVRPYLDVQDIDDYLARQPDPPQHTWAAPPAAEPYVFVLMPFETDWSTNVKDTIDQACQHVASRFAGLSWARADDITDPGRITHQIIAAIERADLLIADITNSNPNVLFELGYADALNKPIIVLNQVIDDTPFDIKDWRQIQYSTNDLPELSRQLAHFLTGPLRRQGFPPPSIGAQD